MAFRSLFRIAVVVLVLVTVLEYRHALVTLALLVSVYFAIRVVLPAGHTVAWPALVVLAAAIGAPALAVLTALAAGIALDWRSETEWSLLPHRIDVTAAVAVVVFLHGAGQNPQAPELAAAGAAVGALAALAMSAGAPTTSERRSLPVGEAIATGVAAALLGEVLLVAGPLLIPLAVAVVLVATTPALARRLASDAEDASLSGLLRALEIKDGWSRGHSERVAAYAEILGKEMGVSGLRLRDLAQAGLLHEIGKVAVPRHLLRKRGRLTPSEYEEIQRHVAAAGDLLKDVQFVAPALSHLLQHREYVTGGGSGINNGSVSLEVRILAVADAFDAMTTHRPYRRALSRRFAMNELIECAGSQFDIDVVAAMVRVLERGEVRVVATGFESDVVARLAALGVSDVPEAIRVSG